MGSTCLRCLALIVFLLVAPNCKKTDIVTQGLQGTISFWEGNFMPGSISGTIKVVMREIYVYELTNSQQATAVDGRFFSDIRTTLVAKVTSNDSGHYQVTLNPGKYSLFVKEGSLFYASSRDGYGNIMPVEVVADSVVLQNVDIIYKAVF
jgi:hypothetical protein